MGPAPPRQPAQGLGTWATSSGENVTAAAEATAWGRLPSLTNFPFLVCGMRGRGWATGGVCLPSSSQKGSEAEREWAEHRKHHRDHPAGSGHALPWPRCIRACLGDTEQPPAENAQIPGMFLEESRGFGEEQGKTLAMALQRAGRGSRQPATDQSPLLRLPPPLRHHYLLAQHC